VLLKRGPAATLAEVRDAADYVQLGRLWAGSDDPLLLLCERGERTFEPEVRNGFDVAAIPLLQQTTCLPVIADPSHAAGRADLVRPLARAAAAAGADGLLVEVHTDPRGAWCDAEQTIGPAEFTQLMREVRAIAAAAATAMAPHGSPAPTPAVSSP
jgi:3-deoxy-7-phosphoheptulonate synthase